MFINRMGLRPQTVSTPDFFPPTIATRLATSSLIWSV
jgi:hypothetical protein